MCCGRTIHAFTILWLKSFGFHVTLPKGRVMREKTKMCHRRGAENERECGKMTNQSVPDQRKSNVIRKSFRWQFLCLLDTLFPSHHLKSFHSSIFALALRQMVLSDERTEKILQIKFPITMQFHYYTRLAFCVVFQRRRQNTHTRARTWFWFFQSISVA